MGIVHKNADHGAEADSFREALKMFETKVTRDEAVTNENGSFTLIEYVNGEGDPPFIKFRITVEAVEVLSTEQYKAIEVKTEKAA